MSCLDIGGPRASERVWALVCGLPEPRRSHKLLMPTIAYIDDSGTGQPPVLVLAGYIATAESWARFADDWQRILNRSPKPAYFKFEEAMKLKGQFAYWQPEQRDEWMEYFFNAISEHVIGGIGVYVSYEGFRNTFQSDCMVPKQFKNPYFFAFYSLIQTLNRIQGEYGINEPVDFIFDEQVIEMRKVRDAWSQFLLVPSLNRETIGNEPVFRKDTEHLPLQAADLLAGMIRMRWIEREKNLSARKMPWERGRIQRPLWIQHWNEDDLRMELAERRKASGLPAN